MATEDNKDRILVVDDEAAVRELTIRAMNQEGFTCDPAINGEQALKMLEITPYVAVITDLRMPQIHGHALAVDLLHRDDRPVVFVLTGIVEPKLTKDFLSRGVDDERQSIAEPRVLNFGLLITFLAWQVCLDDMSD